MIFKDNHKPSERDLETTSIRVFDTKRTVFIKDGEVRYTPDANLTREQQVANEPYFTVGDVAKEAKINDNKVFKTYPEKGTTVDYTPKIVEIAKTMQGNYRKLVGVHTATSYGYVNSNDRLYHLDSIKANATTFYTPNEIPFIYDHNTYDSKKTIGRVFHAQPIYYDIPKSKINDLRIPKASIRAYTVVTDNEAIEGIMDMRYLTLSAGFKSKAAEVYCSICGAGYFDNCEHKLGQDYEGKRAYFIVHGMRYNDLSYVSKPADLFSKNLKWELVTGDAYNEKGGLDMDKLQSMVDSHEAEYLDDGFGTSSDISFYLIDSKSDKVMVDLFDLDEYKMEDIFGNDWKCIGGKCTVEPNSKVKQNGTTEPHGNDNIKSEEEMKVTIKQNDDDTVTKDGCPCEDESTTDEKKEEVDKKEETETKKESLTEEDKVTEKMAALNIVHNLMATSSLSSEDAVSLLKSQNVIMLVDDDNLPDSKLLLSLIDNYLDEFYAESNDDDKSSGDKDTLARANKVDSESDKKTKRKEICKSSFCGPSRSWPVTDAEHVKVARAFLGQSAATRNLNSSQKTRIRTCVNRKASVLGCDTSK